MNCEACGRPMHWVGSLSKGKMECAYCLAQHQMAMDDGPNYDKDPYEIYREYKSCPRKTAPKDIREGGLKQGVCAGCGSIGYINVGDRYWCGGVDGCLVQNGTARP